MNLRYYLPLALLVSSVHAGICQADTVQAPKRTIGFAFGGYAKLDLVLSRFGNGQPNVTNPIRDMYIPGAIPVGEERPEFDTHLHAKESRFNFEVTSELLGRPVRGFVELDFLLSSAGDQRVSNSYNPRIRHFFFQWGNWLFGQTWTTFMTVPAIPDGIIFVPGAEGLVFNRQGLIRYKHNNWSFALENPETTITAYQEGGTFEITSGGLPDMIAKYDLKGEWGVVGFAAMYRLLIYEDENVNRFTRSGYGLTAQGVLFTGGRDNVRFMITHGSGLGRYLGFALPTAAVLSEDNQINPVQTTNVALSLTHYWSDKWRSTGHVAFLIANDNSEFTGGTANRYCYSGSISLLYEPDPQLLFGIQLLYSKRELENGTVGDLGRIQFSAKYSFRWDHVVPLKEKG